MARTKGVIQFKGGLGELSFYTDKRYGPTVRRKGGPSKEQIKTLKSCSLVRKHNTDFGTASRGGKLLRTSLYPVITLCGDHSLNTRLQQRLLEVLKSDSSEMAGKRSFSNQKFRCFEPLKLNDVQSFERYFEYSFQKTKAGEVKISVQVYSDSLKRTGATHFKLVSVLSALDFKKKTEIHTVKESLVKVSEGTWPIELVHPPAQKGILFFGVCVVFYQQVNEGLNRLMKDGLKCGVMGWVDLQE